MAPEIILEVISHSLKSEFALVLAKLKKPSHKKKKKATKVYFSLLMYHGKTSVLVNSNRKWTVMGDSRNQMRCDRPYVSISFPFVYKIREVNFYHKRGRRMNECEASCLLVVCCFRLSWSGFDEGSGIGRGAQRTKATEHAKVSGENDLSFRSFLKKLEM